MNKYSYRIETISNLALSPRQQHAFYLDVGDFKREQLERHFSIGDQKEKVNRINIIYPFYQYGEYASYEPEHTEYYLPGSSIKGTILASTAQTSRSKIMVDDIRFDHSYVQLNTLYKLQNTSKANNERVILEPFFPNVAVEMIKKGSALYGEMICEADVKIYLESAHHDTTKKFNQFIAKLDSVIDQVSQDKVTLIEKLRRLKSNILQLLESTKDKPRMAYTLLLGGYKGLSLSGTFDGVDFSEVDSALFIDTTTYLPYGIVEVTLQNE